MNQRSRVLLEKITGLQLVKKFPAFYATRMFITASISAHHLSLLNQINQVHAFPTHDLKPILILSFHLCLGLPSVFFISGLPTKIPYAPLMASILAT
jgi:hypothetical protein